MSISRRFSPCPENRRAQVGEVVDQRILGVGHAGARPAAVGARRIVEQGDTERFDIGQQCGRPFCLPTIQ
jgi:hypothetical protein